MDLRRKSDSICFTPPTVMQRNQKISQTSYFMHTILKSNLPCSAKTSHKEFWPRLANECQIRSIITLKVDQGQANMGFHQYLLCHEFLPTKDGQIILLCLYSAHIFLAQAKAHHHTCANGIFAVDEHETISEYRSSFTDK